jgi:hypothetical protein
LSTTLSERPAQRNDFAAGDFSHPAGGAFSSASNLLSCCTRRQQERRPQESLIDRLSPGFFPVDVPPAGPALSSIDSTTAELPPLDESLLAASQPFVGKWNRLVSTTNWHKGRIIGEWRESLLSQGLSAFEYSDEAWSRLVGGVTGQHVGRLRRVFQRFGDTQEQYPGLYWSHFQAALDWSDAEMWLEGAVASGWSVAQMREQRWQTLGQLESDRPRAADVALAETDEDFEPARTKDPIPHSITGRYDEVQTGPRLEGPDFGDDDGSIHSQSGGDFLPGAAGSPVELIRPFERLPDLPDDLAEAFDSFKLAILRHKTDGWSQIAPADVLLTLDALKALVTAPSSAEQSL